MMDDKTDKQEIEDEAVDYISQKEDGTPRSKELSELVRYQEKLRKLANDVEDEYVKCRTRSNTQMDYWDIYDCKMNDNQSYNGNASIYVPLVHDAINARVTRFTNQIFPFNGRRVDVVTVNGDIPHAEMALMENYIDKAKLRTEIFPALVRNGDIEGQYNIYVGWQTKVRHTVYKEMIPIKVDDMDIPGEEAESITSETIYDSHPVVEVLPDADVIVYPPTVDSIEEALSVGGWVAITRRWSKAKIQEMVDSGDFSKGEGESLLGAMREASSQDQDPKKKHVSATGIQSKGKYYVGREVWHTLKVDKKIRIVRSYFSGSEKKVLGTKLNPFWCDLVPIISAPVEKVSGSFKGNSKVGPVEQLQYYANDIINEAADSATYALMPIVMTDPLKNPKTNSMVLDLGAVWEVSPNDTRFASFPALWQQGFEIVNAIKSQIQQTLGVNPSMIPQSTGKGAKRNQAEVAQEQSVDLLTTADAVTILEEGVLNPMLERFAAYDAQFRMDDLLVKQYGQMGRRAQMEKVKPIQMNNRFMFRWSGSEQARNAAQVQQQISFVNVLKGMGPDAYPGYKLNIVPLLEAASQNIFGPRMAPLIFQDLKEQMTVDPEKENEMMMQGFPAHVSPFDDDQKHIKVHEIIAQTDPIGNARAHIMEHQASMKMKAMQAAQAAMPQGQGGQQQGPRPGAQPGQQRPAQQPPGAIHKDRMAGAGAPMMPRKT